MLLHATKHKITFDFNFKAGTSRGVLTQKTAYFVFITDLENENQAVFGIGEAAPLKGLSCDDVENYEEILANFIQQFNTLQLEVFDFNLQIIVTQLIPNQYPSIRFAFETALYDILNGGKRLIFESDFTKSAKPIPINGLVWMGDEAFMKSQIEEKLAQGFRTIKMKIGAIDFETELKLLHSIRCNFDENAITLRVDANGAFDASNVKNVLNELKKLKIHSIEQPIAPKQQELMHELCEENIVPIALDEELIGINDYFNKVQLLKKIKPQYIIIKPTLHGGIIGTKEWIEIAQRNGVAWWMTSALESTIGLNAIAQLTAIYENSLPQGLGTGKIYQKNIESPLEIVKGELLYSPSKSWNIDAFFTI